MSKSGDLRAATRDAHKALEQAPFFRALAEGSAPKQSVVAYLRGLAVIHAVLERSLELEAPGLWEPGLARLPALLADLESCGAAQFPDIDAAVDAALSHADAILADGKHPPSLAGHFYVLEGSMLGGQTQAGLFSAALGTPKRQLAYFDAGTEGVPARWKRVKQRLDAIPASEAGAVEVSARAAFGGVGKLAAACFPVKPGSLRRRVTALNPEAGRHAMPQEDREIALALQAADAAWRRHPYLEARYGARGRRFTLSDSCWLVSLRAGGEEELLRSIRWLAGVLAPRGIPTLILERHLEAIDERFGDSRFAAAAADLRVRRAAVLPAPDFSRVCARWQKKLLDHGAAELLVCAIADEAAGNAGAWESARSWFSDPARFPKDWRKAVEDLTTETRAALR